MPPIVVSLFFLPSSIFESFLHPHHTQLLFPLIIPGTIPRVFSSSSLSSICTSNHLLFQLAALAGSTSPLPHLSLLITLHLSISPGTLLVSTLPASTYTCFPQPPVLPMSMLGKMSTSPPVLIRSISNLSGGILPLPSISSSSS